MAPHPRRNAANPPPIRKTPKNPNLPTPTTNTHLHHLHPNPSNHHSLLPNLRETPGLLQETLTEILGQTTPPPTQLLHRHPNHPSTHLRHRPRTLRTHHGDRLGYRNKHLPPNPRSPTQIPLPRHKLRENSQSRCLPPLRLLPQQHHPTDSLRRCKHRNHNLKPPQLGSLPNNLANRTGQLPTRHSTRPKRHPTPTRHPNHSKIPSLRKPEPLQPHTSHPILVRKSRIPHGPNRRATIRPHKPHNPNLQLNQLPRLRRNPPNIRRNRRSPLGTPKRSILNLPRHPHAANPPSPSNSLHSHHKNCRSHK